MTLLDWWLVTKLLETACFFLAAVSYLGGLDWVFRRVEQTKIRDAMWREASKAIHWEGNPRK